MKQTAVTINRWTRRRRNAAGKLNVQKLWTVNFRCPETGQKRRLSFRFRADAEAHRDVVLAEIAGERYFIPNTNPTVAEVVDHWVETKQGTIKSQSMRGYRPHLKIIIGPILQGTPQERVRHSITGAKPHRDAKLLQMLGPFKVSELTTAQLRRWHTLVRNEVGIFTANRVISMLKGILALAEEDFGVRVCSFPTNLAQRKAKPKKDILAPHEVAKLLDHAKTDTERGIFYAFPILTGVRVSEQLGLLWEDVDLDRNTVTIRRVLERDGTTTDQTKTQAGERDIPISPTLCAMLLTWRLICPRLEGKLYRAFPSSGRCRTKGEGDPFSIRTSSNDIGNRPSKPLTCVM